MLCFALNCTVDWASETNDQVISVIDLLLQRETGVWYCFKLTYVAPVTCSCPDLIMSALLCEEFHQNCDDRLHHSLVPKYKLYCEIKNPSISYQGWQEDIKKPSNKHTELELAFWHWSMHWHWIAKLAGGNNFVHLYNVLNGGVLFCFLFVCLVHS